MTASTRPAAVAGLFYPDDPNQLVAMVDADVGGARLAPDAPVPPKAIVAPHAGYVYSGPIAGTAYATSAATTSSARPSPRPASPSSARVGPGSSTRAASSAS